MGKIIFIFAISIFLTACGPTAEAPSTDTPTAEAPPAEAPSADPAAIDPTEEYLSWRLTSTDSLEYFPEISAYAGNEEIRGWLIEAPVFGTENFETRFRVIPEDAEKLPPPYQEILNYRIEAEMVERLGEYSENNPAKVRVVAVRSTWEAAPFMEIAEVL